MPYIPPGRARSSSLPFLQALTPHWLSMDEAEEREHQQDRNTRSNARHFAGSLFRRHKSESSADDVPASSSAHTDNLLSAANSDMSDATKCTTSAELDRGTNTGGESSATEEDTARDTYDDATTHDADHVVTESRLRSLFRNRVGEFCSDGEILTTQTCWMGPGSVLR